MQLLRKLLPGLLPLFVFIAVDEIYGTETGLYVAIAFGVVQFFGIRILYKNWDRFVLFDTLLLVVLGGVSLLLENETLFLWKPVLMEIILLAIIGISAFSSHNFVLKMTGRYFRDFTPDENQERQMKRLMKLMFGVIILHVALSIYSVYYLSHEAWAFITGVLLYIIFGVIVLFQFIKQRFFSARSTEEYLPEIDMSGKITGRMSREEAHDGSLRLHPVIHLHIINPGKGVLLQLRPQDKKVQPGKWDTSVGGHVSWGESIDQALHRESREEVGVKPLKPVLIKQYEWQSGIEHELVFMFAWIVENELNLKHTDEVEELRWWTFRDIQKNLRKGIFTPNFEQEFEHIRKVLKI